MKRIILAVVAFAMASVCVAQNVPTQQMKKEWRQMKQMRDYSKQAKESAFPMVEAPAQKGVQALPEDRVWFPGEWEEVQAIVVTPYYDYEPDTNLGAGYYMADPAVTGVAEYYRYTSAGWVSTGKYGPYTATMDTSDSFAKVFFYLMDGIQLGGAEAWVRVEQASDTAKVLRTLQRFNLRSDNVRFIIGAGNSFWYRDCGPICFYYGDQDSVAMLDFEYYPGRALDDSLPSLIHRQMGIPNYINTIEWEGGNCLVDGAGFLFTSDAVYGSNADRTGQLTWNGRDISTIGYTYKPSLSQRQTREALASLLGQRETHVLTAYKYDGGTGHVDLYADMCEENGFVFSVMPSYYSSWTDYRTGARNIDSLCSYTSIFDRPYYQMAIPFPSTDNGGYFSNQSTYNNNYTRTYSNHTFVNNVILQPCFSDVVNGHPRAVWDNANIEALKAAYPGYTIYPIDVRDFDGTGGAIHCVTKQIPAENPVRILHKSIVGSVDAMRGSNIPVSAIITNKSGIAHAECSFRINGGEWQSVALNANGNKFSSVLPTSDISDRIVDTVFVPGTRVDSILLSIDTALSVTSRFDHVDTLTMDSVYVFDTIYSYSYNYSYDTINYIDTVTSLRDTMVTVEYYLSATSNNGKTITKPITAAQGGYYSFFFDGNIAELDSNAYDFSTEPRPATDITFVFDAQRTYFDTNAAPGNPYDDTTLAIMQVAENAFGQFFPNPSHEQASINIDFGDGGNYDIAVVDNMGRTVHTTQIRTAGSIRFSIRTDKLATGVYSVVFSGNGQRVVRRLVVK